MSQKKYPPIEIGQKYGRLTVIREDPKKKIDQRCWFVRCVCGTEKSIRQAQLKNGSSQSCGCLQRERSASAGPQRTKHGHTIGHTEGGSVSSEYSTWQQMKNRCTNNRCPGWKHYGGRGITVCDRWLNSFNNFLADVGPKPKSEQKLTLGRIDNDKGYEPGNVEWQTYLQQAANKRINTDRLEIGKILGTFTIIEILTQKYRIRCSCGKEKTIGKAYFNSGRVRCFCNKNLLVKNPLVKSPTKLPKPKRPRKIKNREPWQIALHEASERRKANR